VSTNPYYSPEKFGLALVAEHELSEPCYSFDILAVWRGPAGLYLGTDAGCSCPSPFENYSGMGDMTGPLTTDQALEEASSLKGTSTYDIDGFNEFIAAIRASESVELPTALTTLAVEQ
jgi:hypothetical protein